MSDTSLSERAGSLGFPLLEIFDAHATLADVVKSRDLRLWEGFPVMLANASRQENIDYETILSHLEKEDDRQCLSSLVQMSLALYKAAGEHVAWADEFYRTLSQDDKKQVALLADTILNDHDFTISRWIMSGQRLKQAFNNYYIHTDKESLDDFLSMRDQMSVEYALSQIFSPKQKELVFKKLKGEKLTKTEKEYFSRTVRKKLSALAHPDVHRLAQRILQ